MSSEQEKILEFLGLVGKLKHLKRTGWVLRGVEDPETVAGHMYRMAMMTFLIEDPALDRVRCMEVALVHDLAESIVGDITPCCGVSKEEKYRREMEAMDQISVLLGKTGSYFHSLFVEYEDQKTPESHLVRDLDLFDMALQGFEYEKKEGAPGRLQEFFDSVAGKFTHPFVLNLYQTLEKQRLAHTLGPDLP